MLYNLTYTPYFLEKQEGKSIYFSTLVDMNFDIMISMTTTNHILWGATIGRLAGMPVQGAIAGSMPDLFTVPFFGYYLLKHKTPPENAPRALLRIYTFLHNWFFALGLCIVLYLISPKLAILGLAYFWHVFEDAFVHTKMATSFLYPLWKGKIQVYSASDHKWVQVVDLMAILFVNLIISRVI